MRNLRALVMKDLLWSIRELEFLVYLVVPVIAAVGIRLLAPLMTATPTPTDIAVAAAPSEAVLVQALRDAPLLTVHAASDWAAAQAMVEARKVTTAVELPAGTTVGLGQTPPPTVRLFHDTRSISAYAKARKMITQALERVARPEPAVAFAETYASGASSPFDMQAFLIEVALSFALLFTGVFVVPLTLAEEREKGHFEALLLAGTSVRTLLAGKAAFGLLMTTLVSTLLVGLTSGPLSVLPALLHLLPAALCFVGLGLATALLVQTRKQAELGAALVMMVVAVPAFGAQGSPAMSAVAHAFPLAPLSEGLRATLEGRGQPASAWAFELGILFGYAALGFAVAGWRARRLAH